MLAIAAVSLLTVVVSPVPVEDLVDQLLLLASADNAVETSDRLFPALHQDNEDVVGSLLAGFMPAGQFRISDGLIERILMSKDILVPEGLDDPIDGLMNQLRTKDRRQAVKHFIKHNRAEIIEVKKKMDKTCGILEVMRLQLQRLPPVLRDSSLFDEVTKYVRHREGRCMYDHIPMEFRDTVKYDAMFTELDGVSLSRSRPSDVQGILMYVDSDSLLSHQGATMHRDYVTGIVKLVTDDSTTFVHTRCAAILNPAYRNFIFYPGMRSLAGYDKDIAFIWREDSLEPVTIPFPADSSVAFFATHDAIYFGYEGPPRGGLDRLMFSRHGIYFVIFDIPGLRRNLQRRFYGVRYASGLTGTFKLSTRLRQPFVAQSLTHEVNVEDNCTVYDRPVDAEFADEYIWEKLSQLSTGISGEIAICHSHVDWLFSELLGSFDNVASGDRYWNTIYPALTPEMKNVVRYMFGMSDTPATLKENQRTLMEVIALVKEGKKYEAWLIVPRSGLWLIKWRRDFAARVARETTQEN